MILEEFLKLPGAKVHDGGSPPDDYDRGHALFSDGTVAVPVGHQWVPFNDLVVIAYRPAQ